MAGCAASQTDTAWRAEQELTGLRYADGALSLREAIAELPDDAHKERHKLMMSLARAQLCASVQHREPEMAVATGQMLHQYEGHHAQQHAAAGTDQSIRYRFEQHQIARARREARLAHEEPRTWARGRCLAFGSLDNGWAVPSNRQWHHEHPDS